MTSMTGAPGGRSPEPIVLRPWTTDDLEALIAIYTSTPDLDWELPHPVTTLAQARDLVTGPFAWAEDRCPWAIVVGGEPAGHVAISHLGSRHRTGWVSYFSADAVRGRHLTGRAVAAACTWALSELGVFRLELGHRLDNPASGGVARAAGFVPEGIERSKLQYGERRYDVQTYARLATDPVPVVENVRLQPPA